MSKLPYIKEHPDTAFTMLTRYLIPLVDKGESIPIKQVYEMCSNNTLIPWLEKNADLSFWDDDSKTIMAVEFDSFANCYTADDFGIENNGILFLVAMCQCFIKTPPSRTIEDCI